MLRTHESVAFPPLTEWQSNHFFCIMMNVMFIFDTRKWMFSLELF